MSDVAEALAGPAWFVVSISVVHFISVEAGLAFVLVTMLLALAWIVPDYYIRPL